MKKILFILIFVFSISFVFSQQNISIDTVVGTFYTNISKKEYLSKKDCSIRISNKTEVKKIDDSYSLKVNDKIIVLQDSFEEDNPSYICYQYMGEFLSIGLLCFRVDKYEIGTILLINQYTGNSIEFFGEPTLSPKSELMFNASQIMNYDPFPNNIQIWTIKDNQIKLCIEYQLDNWIPEDVKWVNEKTIFFRQRFEDNSILYAKIDLDSCLTHK